VYADGATVYVKDEITVRKDEVIYEWGKSLKSFEASQDISALVSGVECIGWDVQEEEPFTGEAGLEDIPVKIGGGSDWEAVSKGGLKNAEKGNFFIIFPCGCCSSFFFGTDSFLDFSNQSQRYRVIVFGNAKGRDRGYDTYYVL